MAPIIVYGMLISPPVRAVLLAGKALGLDMELSVTNLLAAEHLSPDYIKKNPTHTVPVIDDNGFVLFESNAINGYLVQQYGKDKSLYPTDPKKRALVDSRLHFNSGVMFSRLRYAVSPFLLGLIPSIPQSALDSMDEAYGFIEALLTLGPWLTGNTLTIADLNLGTTVSTCVLILPAPNDKYPKLNAWLNKLSKLPYYSINQKGLDEFQALYEAKLKDNNLA